MKFLSNAKAVAKLFLNRAQRTPKAMRAGLTAVAIAVNEKKIENLSGGDNAAGSFPIPVRSGNLRRHADMQILSSHAEVMNTATYAMSIHERSGPFLNGTLDQVNTAAIFAMATRKSLGVA